MNPAVAVPTLALGALLALSGCGSLEPPRGLASPSYSNDHSTAAGGFGLGPSDFKTNGGAFGPDTADH